MDFKKFFHFILINVDLRAKYFLQKLYLIERSIFYVLYSFGLKLLFFEKNGIMLQQVHSAKIPLVLGEKFFLQEL